MMYEELRERVARDIARADGSDFAFKGYVGSIYHGEEDHYRDLAADAIRAVIETLAQEAESGHSDCLTPCASECDDGWCVHLSDWLRAHVPEVQR